jgi:pyruvate,water dikinase
MAAQKIIWFDKLGSGDVTKVGGKNASLGEMIQNLTAKGVRVPMGFATTAAAYREFLQQDGLGEKIYSLLAELDVHDIAALEKIGAQVRNLILETQFSSQFINEVTQAFKKLEEMCAKETMTVAVRSSATAEDLPEASFAGQHETYLNISGLDNVFIAIKEVFASLFNDRAITYRAYHGFEHQQVFLSAGIQYMVRSDIGASGVMFSIDTESGFQDVVLINAAYGLGETVVQGSVNPDEYYVYKPNLTNKNFPILRKNLGNKKIKMIYSDDIKKPTQVIDVEEEKQLIFTLDDAEIQELANYAAIIENHYAMPMDIEWAKDGEDGKLYIVQARPETVKSRSDLQILKRYTLKTHGKVLIEGRSVGQLIGQGKARVLKDISAMAKLQEGDVLVTDMTDPDWEPIMKKSAAIVTNRGGRTCHAAIVARELGIPAVVGCGNATELISDGQEVTVSCAEGDAGFVYEGLLEYTVDKLNSSEMPEIPVKIMMNIGNPDLAFSYCFIPNHGVGLARLEFIINNMIGIHPKALLNFAQLPKDLQTEISQRTSCYADPVSYYVHKLREGIATIAAAFYPKPVIVRTSDFKSNEYANLLGGHLYEPEEENPMLGFRGASRYIDASFKDCFELECQALHEVRNKMGFTNVVVMIPFTRTVEEGKQIIALLAANGLKQGVNDLKIIMMCEIPSNVILADEFLRYFDGFSIGSNDLTQLTLGLDRDSSIIAHLFDERNAAVKSLLSQAIQACNKLNKYIGICGQGPSDHPDLAEWLLEQGIETMSLNPDTVVPTWLRLAKK